MQAVLDMLLGDENMQSNATKLKSKLLIVMAAFSFKLLFALLLTGHE